MAKKFPKLNPKLLIAAAAVVILVGLFFWLHKPAKTATIPTISQPKAASTASTNASKVQAGSGSSDKTANSTPAAADSTVALIAPYGSFVSSHHVSLGSGDIEESDCNTTPGASCYIQFSNNGITRTLATQTADSTGFATWKWNSAQAGLSSGSWQITAIAALGSQTKSTSDSLNLEVQ